MVSTTEQLLAVSWQQLGPKQDGLAAVFYDRLFTLDPTLRELFRNVDSSEQDKKLTGMLRALVYGTVTTDALIALGCRHADYGVLPEHYGIVADALLWSLAHQLGPTWTSAMRTAWNDTLTRVAMVMLSGERRRRC